MISLKIIPVVVVITIVAYLASLSFMSRHHRIKPEGLRELSPCPNTPNCISSEAKDNLHAIAAFALIDNDPGASWDKFIAAINQAGGEILINDGNYCHAVFTSRLFRFKDDIEGFLREDKIAIRSASRVGHSDMGQNRKRMEKIRMLYQ